MQKIRKIWPEDDLAGCTFAEGPGVGRNVVAGFLVGARGSVAAFVVWGSLLPLCFCCARIRSRARPFQILCSPCVGRRRRVLW